MSTFKVLSELINVNDICEPFIGEFDSSQDAQELSEEWPVMCCEKGLDPMEPIGLVKRNQKIIGWICLGVLESPKKLYECMDPISADILISSSTPLLEAIHLYCSGDNYTYLVLKGNQSLILRENNQYYYL